MAWGREWGLSMRKVLRFFILLGVVNNLSVITRRILQHEVPLILALPGQLCYSYAEVIHQNCSARVPYANGKFYKGMLNFNNETLQIGQNTYDFKVSSMFIWDANFEARMTFGNKSKNGISMAQWNAGQDFLSNKHHEICHIVEEHKFLIFCITESAFFKSQNFEDIKLKNYTTYFSKTLDSPNLETRRVAVYIHKDMTVKVREDLMNDTFSSVWLELGKPRQKKILFCALYRDWKYLNQTDDSSSTIESQMDRWISFLDQWERAVGSGKEICVMGDINLNFLNWMSPNSNLTSHARRLEPLVTVLFD